jgi:hypothetical protein
MASNIIEMALAGVWQVMLSVSLLGGQGCAGPQVKNNMADEIKYFEGVQARLEAAILTDRPEVVREAVAAGAELDATGREGVTPVIFAFSRKKKIALEELLRLGADPNIRANNGQSAVTVAARIALTDIDYLKILLSHGGDPDARGPNDEPIGGLLIGQRNNDGLRLLASHGANLNALDRTQTPLILQAALIRYWDTVWTLIELGVNWRVERMGITVPWIVHTGKPSSDSPMLPWWEKTMEFLKNNDVSFPPASPQEVLSRQRQRDTRPR